MKTDENKKDFLIQRATRFYEKYGPELEQIAQSLEIKLNQLALAYTMQNKLPRECIIVTSRVKTLKSFIKKLERQNWKAFYNPIQIATDLIGTRVICWFLDDCMGIYDYILKTNQFHILPGSLENYIEKPKKSGYRSIHLLAEVPFDRVKLISNKLKIVPGNMVAEIQVRTKLMDVWADLTHEFHYKAKALGIENKHLDGVLKSQSDSLQAQDNAFLNMRNVYQQMVEKEQTKKKKREGFAGKS